MKVFETNSVKKRKYQYKTVNLNETGLKGWEISTSWGNRAPRKDVDMDKDGNILILVRKLI